MWREKGLWLVFFAWLTVKRYIGKHPSTGEINIIAFWLVFLAWFTCQTVHRETPWYWKNNHRASEKFCSLLDSTCQKVHFSSFWYWRNHHQCFWLVFLAWLTVKRYTGKHPCTGIITISALEKSWSFCETTPDNKEIHGYTIKKLLQVIKIFCQRIVYNTRTSFESHPFACIAISAFSFNLSALFIILSCRTNSKHPSYSQCWWLENSWYLYLVRLKNTYQDWFLTRILLHLVSSCFKNAIQRFLEESKHKSKRFLKYQVKYFFVHTNIICT